jgi:hypothetical protein
MAMLDCVLLMAIARHEYIRAVQHLFITVSVIESGCTGKTHLPTCVCVCSSGGTRN